MATGIGELALVVVIVIGELALVVVIVIGELALVVVIVMGMLIDSLRLLARPGSAAGMASLAVGLGLAVGGPRVRLGNQIRRPDQRSQRRT